MFWGGEDYLDSRVSWEFKEGIQTKPKSFLKFATRNIEPIANIHRLLSESSHNKSQYKSL